MNRDWTINREDPYWTDQVYTLRHLIFHSRMYLQLVFSCVNGSAHCSGCVVDGPSAMAATWVLLLSFTHVLARNTKSGGECVKEVKREGCCNQGFILLFIPPFIYCTGWDFARCNRGCWYSSGSSPTQHGMFGLWTKPSILWGGWKPVYTRTMQVEKVTPDIFLCKCPFSVADFSVITNHCLPHKSTCFSYSIVFPLSSLTPSPAHFSYSIVFPLSSLTPSPAHFSYSIVFPLSSLTPSPAHFSYSIACGL